MCIRISREPSLSLFWAIYREMYSLVRLEFYDKLLHLDELNSGAVFCVLGSILVRTDSPKFSYKAHISKLKVHKSHANYKGKYTAEKLMVWFHNDSSLMRINFTFHSWLWLILHTTLIHLKKESLLHKIKRFSLFDPRKYHKLTALVHKTYVCLCKLLLYVVNRKSTPSMLAGGGGSQYISQRDPYRTSHLTA